jgi:hypothetical protein
MTDDRRPTTDEPPSSDEVVKLSGMGFRGRRSEVRDQKRDAGCGAGHPPFLTSDL